jgi:hypothetical protein
MATGLEDPNVVRQKYVIYGLGIHSEIPLWGRGVAACRRDILVTWEQNADIPQAEVGGEPLREGDRDEIRLVWPSICDMTIRSGTEIVIRTGANPEPTHLRHLISGIGLGLALYQRGIFTLHAGAVAIAGRAVAIVGPKGAGKSTLVAALSARGHLLLSDDVAALTLPDDAPPMVLVGASNVNLWPDSAVATGHDAGSLTRIWSRSPKLAGSIRPSQPSESVPLGAIVVLTRNDGSAELEELAPIDSFTQLATHSHAFRWIAHPPNLPHHLMQCRKILEHVSVFRTRRGESLDSLSDLTERVEGLAASWAERTVVTTKDSGCRGALETAEK